MKRLHDYYEESGLWERARFTEGYEPRRLMEGVELIPGDCRSLLDVGCGNGAFLALVEQHRPNIQATGLEPSQTALQNRWCRSQVVRGYISDLPFVDRSFDVVASMAVLEHIPGRDIGSAVSELMRLSNRYILLDLPYREQRTRIRCDECGCGFDPHLHLRVYDDAQIAKLFPGFVERRRIVLRGKESLLAYCLLRLLRFELSARYFPNVVCPQCGHRTSAPSDEVIPESPLMLRKMFRRLWRMQPKILVEREVFVLFERMS